MNKYIALLLLASSTQVLLSKTIIYGSDIDNDLELTITTKEGQVIKKDLPGREAVTVEVPTEIKELVIFESKATFNKKDTLKAGSKDETLNGDTVYVITHNRINPLRGFRLLSRKDIVWRKMPYSVLKSINSFVVDTGLTVVGLKALGL